MRALELYAGIGGFALASHGLAEIVGAIEQSDVATRIYRDNFSHPVAEKNITGLNISDFEKYQADLWWMSPPCQPYTSRGNRQDLQDPRSRSFQKVIGALAELQPKYVALENVPGFKTSQAREQLLVALHGYHVREELLCPTLLGVPNRRERYYLLAARTGLSDRALAKQELRPLASFLEPNPAPDLQVSAEQLERYRHAMSILDPSDPQAIASCFTGAYGRSPTESGSYLNNGGAIRRFSPRELLNLLGFPPEFRLNLPLEASCKLIGNSLSIPAVRAMLSLLPA